MPEMNFCPYCDAPQHKLLLCKKNVFFCKTCNRFFRFEDMDITCPRCKGELRKSDFPSPKGETVFFCTKCKRPFPTSEIMENVK